MNILKSFTLLSYFSFLFFLAISSFVFSNTIDPFIPGVEGLTPIDKALLQNDTDLARKLFDSSIVDIEPQDMVNAEISLGIVDLKFDGEQIKICEFGEGVQSTFKGFDRLYGKGSIWRRFWHFLAFIDLPVWYVSSHDRNNAVIARNAYDDFAKMGGRFVSNLSLLCEHRFFKNLLKEEYCYQLKGLTNYKALVIGKKKHIQDQIFRKLKKTYSSVLFLNEASDRFMGNKFYTNQLFQDDQLKKYRPHCRACIKKFYPGLAEELICELGCDCFVIKPISAARGWGVIIVKKEDLEKTLKLILGDRDQLEKMDDIAYKYWLHDKNKIFLVEEYAPSKIISVSGINYDPTMRVVFVLSCDQGKIRLNILGSYWKLPAKGIDEEGTLIEQHKSNINPNRECSAFVDQEDYEKVKDCLREVLPKIYLKMLKHREAGEILPLRVKKI